VKFIINISCIYVYRFAYFIKQCIYHPYNHSIWSICTRAVRAHTHTHAQTHARTISNMYILFLQSCIRTRLIQVRVVACTYVIARRVGIWERARQTARWRGGWGIWWHTVNPEINTRVHLLDGELSEHHYVCLFPRIVDKEVLHLAIAHHGSREFSNTSCLYLK
jgi:hypothetical protein